MLFESRELERALRLLRQRTGWPETARISLRFALLVLWRDIAWEDGRKPRKDFELTVADVLESEQTLRRSISTLIGAS